MGEASPRRIFSSAQLGGLTLRNRVIKAATYEGMCPDGIPSPGLTKHHRDLAAGGVGMTTVAYCAVSPNGRTFAEQMYINDLSLKALKVLADEVHESGGKVSMQLTHCGYFSKNKSLSHPLAPSRVFNAYGFLSGLMFSKAMTSQRQH